TLGVIFSTETLASASTVTTGAASRAVRAWSVSAPRSTVLSLLAASLSTGAACAAVAPPMVETSRPPAVATTAARRPAAADGAASTGRRAARCLPRVVRAVTFNLSLSPTRTAVGFGWEKTPGHRELALSTTSPQGHRLRCPKVGPPLLPAVIRGNQDGGRVRRPSRYSPEESPASVSDRTRTGWRCHVPITTLWTTSAQHLDPPSAAPGRRRP